MENKNTGLIVLVIILSLMVVGLSSFVIYDKVLSDNEQKEENKDNLGENTSEENNNNLESDPTKENISTEEIKEIFEFVYNYYELPQVYCGKSEITNRMPESGYALPYEVSLEFKSYDEMLSHLKKYMSEEVISNKQGFSSTDRNWYFEDENKLFCLQAGKGYPYTFGDIDIEITLKNKNTITGLATMELTDWSNNKTYDKVNITLELNNNNWIITSYEKQ